MFSQFLRVCVWFNGGEGRNFNRRERKGGEERDKF
jgi:hypothetical protein